MKFEKLYEHKNQIKKKVKEYVCDMAIVGVLGIM